MLKCIKTLRSHVDHARFLAQCSAEPVGQIPCQADIPSPYRFSPTWLVYEHFNTPCVVIVETAHRKFQVFEVPPEMVQPWEGAEQVE
jgi:hypothetical protein